MVGEDVVIISADKDFIQLQKTWPCYSMVTVI